MRESKIEGYLRREIAKLGGWCEKHVSPGTRGVPDNIVMWPQTVIDGCLITSRYMEFIETKAPDGKLSVLQQRDHERRRKMGFEVHVIWTMEQAEEYLRSRGKRPVEYKVGDVVRSGQTEYVRVSVSARRRGKK